MKRLSFSLIATLVFLSITLTGCAAIGGIFKAGIWVGIVIVIVVVAIIIGVISKSR